ncbi:MAG: hypothetical protein AB1736_07790 [Chloroflexota bacterium]
MPARPVSRHELPDIDAAALTAARAADRLVAVAREVDSERWVRYLAPLPDRLRDDPLPGLRAAARVGRAAFGPKDSVRDALPADVTEPFLAAIDRLLKVIARWEAHRGA